MITAKYIVILLSISPGSMSTETQPVSLQRAVKADLRSESLGRLLGHILRENFDGCVVIIIYDKAIVQQPGLLSALYTNAPFAPFIQRSIDASVEQVPIVFKDQCYNYLIFLDDIYAIKNLIAKETVNKVLLVTESTPWTVKDFLKSFISRSYTNLLIITHSMSKRTEEGSFLLYTHKLYTDGSGASTPVLSTSWIREHMTHKNIDLFPEKLSGGFKGHRLLISTAHQPPFAIRTDRISLGEVVWDGIDIRMIKLLGKTLNFTAEFRDPGTAMSPMYAALMDVEKRETTLAIGGIYRTNNVTARFDSAFSHMEDCAAFISEASLALPKYRAIMGPFQGAVWALVIIAYVIAVIPLATNTNYTLLSLVTHPSRLMHMFWYVFSTFTNSFVVKNPLLDTGIAKNSTSLLIGIYWVFTIIITSCYTGSIMAFITVPMFPEPIDNVEQLLEEGYEIGTLDHDGWEVWFNWTRIDEPVAKELLKELQYVSTIKAGIGNITEAFFWSYAFIGSRILLQYIVQEQFTPSWSTMRSPMHISKECLLNFGVTFALQKDSIYTEEFNKVIIRARQSGLSQKIIRDVEWDVQRTAEGLLLPVSEEYKQRKIPVQDRSLALDDTQGMFLLLGAGILLAFLALSIECSIHLWRKRYSRDVGHTTDVSTVVSVATTPQMNHSTGLDMWTTDVLAPRRRRFTHSDIHFPNFDKHRRESKKHPQLSSKEDAAEAKGGSSIATFVSSLAGMYGLQSSLACCAKSMAASKDVLATATAEVNLADIPEGKISAIKWRGKPVFIYHRSQATIDQEKSVDISQLRDPETDEARVHKPEWLVVIGVCTHLGCVPITNAGMIPGGFYCPCHGSHYDAAGRIRKGPAPTNLEVPAYRFLDEQTILIG